MHIEYKPKGVCSSAMEIDTAEGRIENVKVIGGCDGNLKGLCALLKGMPVEEAIEKLSGIRCQKKATSCPDQLSIALSQALEN